MSLATRLGDLAYAIGTDMKALRVLITGTPTGTVDSLTTTTKASIIDAINEVNAKAVVVPDATDTTKGSVELATLVEVATGTDAVRAVTPEGVRQERLALKTEILGAGVPGALDTLDELAAALGDDANFGATITTSLANRLRVDTAAQGLDATQQANGQTNLGVYSKTELGNPDTDLVALYTAAKA
jgi:hypothetical protein